MQKVCTKCKLSKEVLGNFYKDKKSKDGFSYWCNSCRVENVKKHRENPEFRKRQMIWNNKWRKNNKEKVLFTRKKSQLKRRSLLTGDFTIEDWEYIKNINNYSCKLCSRKEPEIKLTVDHIIPISKNGKHTRENIQPLCRNCNSKKSNKL